MRIARELYRRLRAVVRGRAADARLDEEIRFHLEQETARLVERGYSRDAAGRLARVSFGAAERFREEVREQRGLPWLELVTRELRLSLRRLVREPTFAAATIATLAIGFGAVTAVWALADAVLLRPLPYPASERLVAVTHTVRGEAVDGGLSDGLAAYYADGASSFEVFGTVLENEISLTDGAEPERVRVAMLTPSLLAALAPAPAVGGLFPTERVGANPVLISWELWQRRYGGDAAIVGRQIETNRTPDEVVGVLPQGFDFPRPGTDVWMGWPRDDAGAGLNDLYLTGVARLRPGVTAAAAQRELDGLLERIGERYPAVSEEQLRRAQLRPVVRPLKDVRIADVRAPLVILLVLVGVVLVIAWANVVNLVLLRAERQRREIAIARALGAGAGALVRRVLTEAGLLATAAAAAGVFIASVAVSLRYGFGAGELPRLHEVVIDRRVLAASALLALATTVLLAAVAWLSAGRLRAGGLRPAQPTTSSRGVRRTQQALVGLQVALSLVLLVACGATAQSLQRLLRVDPGFDPQHTVLFELNPPARPYLSYGAASALHARIRDALEAVPGVERVEGAFALPLQPRIQRLRESVAVEGVTSEPAAALVNMVTPGFFDALRIPLRAGRAFVPADLTAEAPGAILSATLARRIFGAADPLGRRIVLVGTRAPALHVVGVADDVVGETLTNGPAAVLYLPAIFAHTFDAEFRATLPYVPRELTVIVRSTLPAATLAPTIRRTIAEIDGKLPIMGLQQAERHVERASARARLVTLLLAIASSAALFLGAVGLWGVVAYALARRAPELAIRIAVGAQPQRVVRLVLRQGLIVTAAGLVVGAALALTLTRSLSAVLFQVDAAAPAVFATATTVLLAIGLLASWVPARRAARIDPARLLRSD